MVPALKFKLLTALSMLLISSSIPALSCEDHEPSATKVPVSQAPETKKLADGFYFVPRQNLDAKKLEPLNAGEVLLANDFQYLEPEEREPTVHVVLQTQSFIPLTMAADPVEDKDEQTGKPRLSLQLTEDQVKPLEEFTRAHVGDTVAIVIGGDVVTTHKVREPITGGHLQVTRCTKHGCYTLYSKLLKNRPTATKDATSSAAISKPQN